MLDFLNKQRDHECRGQEGAASEERDDGRGTKARHQKKFHIYQWVRAVDLAQYEGDGRYNPQNEDYNDDIVMNYDAKSHCTNTERDEIKIVDEKNNIVYEDK